MRGSTLFRLAVAALVCLSAPAFAAFHLMKIVEVFPGTPVAPNAQYVVLQMYAGGQTVVAGHVVTVFDATGAEINSFEFLGNVANGANQAKILIATTQAQTFFGVTANLVMTPVIPVGGGKICFDSSPIDCVAWGNYSGSALGVGAPFRRSTGMPGLLPGRAAIRRLDFFGSPTTLENADDTDNSATDFLLGPPQLRNNAGQAGTPPASTCGNNALESVEQCDDGGTNSGDGCSAVCMVEFCGDSVTQLSEQCDDGNITNGDGCSNMCLIETPLIFLNGFEPLP